MYEQLKVLHIAFAALTITGFILRGTWMLANSPLLNARATRVLPHVVDTLFLATGIGMLFAVSLNPLTQPWLLAKFAGLVAYVVLGSVALKRGRTRAVRATAFMAAIGVFLWISGAAVTKSAWSWAVLAS